MPHCPSVDVSVTQEPLPQAGGGMLNGCAHRSRAPPLGRTAPNQHVPLPSHVWPSLSAHSSEAPQRGFWWANARVAGRPPDPSVHSSKCRVPGLLSPGGGLHHTTLLTTASSRLVQWLSEWKHTQQNYVSGSYVLALTLRLILLWCTLFLGL